MITGCQALIWAYQQSSKDWKVKEVSLEHVICAGGKKTASSRAGNASAAVVSEVHYRFYCRSFAILVLELAHTKIHGERLPLQ